MRKVSSFISVAIIILATGVTSACSIKKEDVTRIDADVRVLKNNKVADTRVTTITDKKRIKKIDKLFSKVVWSHGNLPKMARGEDVIITFFYKTDKNNPEQLVEYHIWYNEKYGATILSGSQEDNVGTLDKEFVLKLQKELSSEISTTVVQKDK